MVGVEVFLAVYVGCFAGLYAMTQLNAEATSIQISPEAARFCRRESSL